MTKAMYGRLSFYYLLMFATIAVFAPYFSLYLKYHGRTSAQIGVIMALIPLTGMVMQPVWGMLNDRFSILKTTLLLGMVVPACLLPFISAYNSMLWYAGIAMCIAVFQTALIPVSDSNTIQLTGVRNYGTVRLWGSFGYAVVVVIIAQVFHQSSIAALPVVYVVAAGVGLIGLSLLPRHASQGGEAPHGPRGHARRGAQGPGLFRGVRELLRNRTFLLLLVFTPFVTMTQSMNNNFFSLYYEALHRPMTMLGVVYAIGAFSELPFFFFSGRLIERFGAERVFLVGGSVFFVRWAALACAPPTWLIAVLQGFHGWSFGLTFAAGVAMASKVSGEGNRATAQTLYSSVNTGVASIVGGLLGGFALGSFGPQGIYATCALFCAIGTALMGWLVVRTSRRRQGTGTETHVFADV